VLERLYSIFPSKIAKKSLRFEIVNSLGLPTTHLYGILGEAILPHDYIIDSTGAIHVGDNVIEDADVTWIEHEDCHQIPNQEVALFYHFDHSAYELSTPFIGQVKLQMHEDASPK